MSPVKQLVQAKMPRHLAYEDMAKAQRYPYDGSSPCKNFVCPLCGYKLQIGDQWQDCNTYGPHCVDCDNS